MDSTTISFRIDTELKNRARAVASDMGIDLSVLVKSCLKTLVKQKRADFRSEVPSDFFIRSLKQAEKDIAEGYVSPTFDNPKDMIAWLHGPNRKYKNES